MNKRQRPTILGEIVGIMVDALNRTYTMEEIRSAFRERLERGVDPTEEEVQATLDELLERGLIREIKLDEEGRPVH